MSKFQVILCLVALLSIYAVASALDDQDNPSSQPAKG